MQHHQNIGYLEVFNESFVQGWAIDTAREVPSIELIAGEERYPLLASWEKRSDVAAKYGEVHIDAGFFYRVSSDVRSKLLQAYKDGKEVAILSSETILLGESFSLSDPSLLTDSDDYREQESQGYKDANIESVENFLIKGWAVSHKGLPVSSHEIKVFRNGEKISTSAIHRPDSKASEMLNLPDLHFGFDIFLPGYIWEAQAGVEQSNEICLLDITIGGEIVSTSSIEISKTEVERWLNQIAIADSAQTSTWRFLLAVEHIRYGNFSKDLSSHVLRYFTNRAEKLALYNFLEEAGDNSEVVVGREEVSEAASTLLLWEAMRALNRQVAEDLDSRTVSESVLKILTRFRLSGEAKEWYLFLAIQLTCEYHDFRRLSSEIDLTHLKKYADLKTVRAPNRMIVVLPLLIIEKRMNWAISLLQSLQHRILNSWFSTECLRFASQEVQSLYFSGEVSIYDLESYHLAIFNLLKAFKSDWFSRLHNAYLVDIVVSILLDLNAYRDSHKKHVMKEAIAIYGLSPSFWEKLEIAEGLSSDTQLLYAKETFEKIQSYFNNQDANNSKDLLEVVSALVYFDSHENPEAVTFLREICLNQLQTYNDSVSLESKSVLSTLLNLDNSSAIRICAFPLHSKNQLQSAFHLTQVLALKGLIQEAIEKQTTDTSAICSSISRNANRLREVVSSRSSEIPSTSSYYEEILKCIVAINNLEEKYLGFDVLTNIFSILLPIEGEHAPLLMFIRQTFETVVASIDTLSALPTPVQAGLSLLRRINSGCNLTILPNLLREIDLTIRNKFGKDFLLQPSSSTQTMLSVQQGWPLDTVVGIFLSNSKADEPSAQFDSAWIRELDARSIPYLFVVGGGDDSIQDKLLKLDVSDDYEDRTIKTLRFFKWAYLNTEYEYVIKVDANTYMDVGNYFDSLCYRKHPYYGQRLQSENFDRSAHQCKCAKVGNQKRLDLSPSTSTYASEDLGYSLSRQAIAQLLKESRTYDGQVIVNNSYRADKAVGDLLSRVSIKPSSESFVCFEQRKNFENAIPVATGSNTFFPGQRSTTKTAYFEDRHPDTFRHIEEKPAELWPKKIWSTCWTVSVKPDSNQLEMLTDARLAFELIEANSTVVISVIRNEMLMLARWLEHYRSLGIRCFIIVDNCSDDGSREFLLSQTDVVLYSSDTQYKYSHYGVTWQQALLGNLCLGKWVVMADADEFLVYENSETRSMLELVESLEEEEADGALVYMIDMYPYGDLSEADFSMQSPFEAAPYFDKDSLTELRFGGGMYSNSRNFVNGFRHRIAPSRINAYVSQKYALFKYYPWLRFSEGVHYAANMTPSEKPVFFAHFKYHNGFKDKIVTEIKRKQHFNGAEEYKRYASILKESRGGFGNEQSSVKYENSYSFMSLAEKNKK